MAETKSSAKNKSNGLVKFIKETNVELKKVVWPTKKQATMNTIIVILASIIMALFIAGTDLGLTQVVERLLFRK